MTTYYQKENNKIIKSTPFLSVAEKWVSYETTEENIVYGYDGKLYLESECPEPPAPTEEEQSARREQAYKDEVDGITAHISRLRDAEQTEEIIAEITKLVAERDAKVAEIKERYPYPTDPITEELVAEELTKKGE